LRICIVYDCLYPWTIGGAEHWYRSLAEGLAKTGHEVTYLTLRQWRSDYSPRLPGVRVVPVGPPMPLYANGRRRLLPPLRFGLGVLLHLGRFGRNYDVVHTASFPYFSLLAAGTLRRAMGYALVADWWEVWTDAFWQAYLGRIGGRVGACVQRSCARLSHRARAASAMQANRLSGLGHKGDVEVVPGVWPGAELAGGGVMTPDPVVVYLGRLVPDKRVEAIPAALAVARQAIPELRALVFGDGPSRSRVMHMADACGVRDVVEMPGFVDDQRLDEALRRALCLVLPSRREGFGLAVLDAVSRGVPVVTVRDPDNAATELVIPGVNGAIADGPTPSQLAAAIVEVAQMGAALRHATSAWWSANAIRFRAETGIASVISCYRDERKTAACDCQP
jgi:glycosyltransferase involved in cell wall biosynthesis